MSKPFAAFAGRDFRFYAASRFLATTAVQMQSVAVSFQMYALTHRPLALGLVGLAQFVPVFLLSLPAGHVADRVERRRLLFACDLTYVACAVALAAVTRAGFASPTAVYAVLVVFGVARAFYGPAASALMPSLVQPDEFSNAAAWNSTMWQVAAVGGPGLGGALYAAAGSAQPVYLVAAVSFALAAALLLFVRPTPFAVEAKRGVDLDVVLAGLRYVWRVKVLLGSISLDLFAVFLGGAVALVPVFATDVLHADALGFGLLRAAPGVGAGLMAIVLAFKPITTRAGAKMFACVALFGVATIVFALSRSLALSLVALAVLGAADMVSVVVRMTLEQAVTPPPMRGRVGAVNMLFIGASNELGEFESGLAAAWLGAVNSVIAGGIGTLAVVAIWSVLFPALRKVDRAEAMTPELAAAPPPSPP
jgi:MFS family permease